MRFVTREHVIIPNDLQDVNIDIIAMTRGYAFTGNNADPDYNLLKRDGVVIDAPKVIWASHVVNAKLVIYNTKIILVLIIPAKDYPKDEE